MKMNPLLHLSHINIIPTTLCLHHLPTLPGSGILQSLPMMKMNPLLHLSHINIIPTTLCLHHLPTLPGTIRQNFLTTRMNLLLHLSHINIIPTALPGPLRQNFLTTNLLIHLSHINIIPTTLLGALRQNSLTTRFLLHLSHINLIPTNLELSLHPAHSLQVHRRAQNISSHPTLSLSHHPSSSPVKNLHLNLNHLQKTFKHPGFQTFHPLIYYPPSFRLKNLMNHGRHRRHRLYQLMQSPKLSPQGRIFDLHLVPTSFAHLRTIAVEPLDHNGHNSHPLVVFIF